jgi:hypothetical protein
VVSNISLQLLLPDVMLTISKRCALVIFVDTEKLKIIQEAKEMGITLLVENAG